MTLAAMAAMTALAAGLVVYVTFVSSPTSAYALEQTAEANDRIMSYHIKITPPPRDNISEFWAEFSPDSDPNSCPRGISELGKWSLFCRHVGREVRGLV